jgi:hypothetical protein
VRADKVRITKISGLHPHLPASKTNVISSRFAIFTPEITIVVERNLTKSQVKGMEIYRGTVLIPLVPTRDDLEQIARRTLQTNVDKHRITLVTS